MGSASSSKKKKMASNQNDQQFPTSMPNPLSVYVPFEALTEQLLKSVISVVDRNPDRYICEGSERPLLCFLLAINNKLKQLEIDGQIDSNSHAKQVQKWLVDRKGNPIDWKQLEEEFEKIYEKVDEKSGRYLLIDQKIWYHEMKAIPKADFLKKSLKCMKQYRPNGFKDEELKVYWNYEQIAELCQKIDQPHDPSDSDVIENLRKFPVEKRIHAGRITYVTKGIEKAVFDVPESAQIILLNFANEESPGGGYLRHAMAQEEVLLYNSDGYRALLDLKYGRMAGGYAIPEFGLAYVRNICVVENKTEKSRKADMLVSACYCLFHPQLYENPRNDQERFDNDVSKFRAFIAAAVANTIGDGSNTYLLLGPIGTGAFGNDTREIAEAFKKALNESLLGMKQPVRYAFENIWFVSIDGWKNDEFAEVIGQGEAPSIVKPEGQAEATTVEPEKPPETNLGEEPKAEAVVAPQESKQDEPEKDDKAKTDDSDKNANVVE